MSSKIPLFHKFLLGSVALFFLWSAYKPHDYFTWFLEVAPAIIAFIILAFTYNRYRLSNLVYTLIALHAIVLIIGGKYTYAEVPLFNWLRDIGIFSRNNYDKIGHFFQGFVPAIVVREILLRQQVVRGKYWLGFIVVCVCLAFSAVYEFMEMWISVLSGTAGDSFLGTQGYIWDTQTDMLLATIGATLALLIFSAAHDRALASLKLTEK